eukprot:TRINITY_DN13863_c0_g1_i1.p1 TRINITY_DN13863_c0_g1~~TRINITY_DN13863_c0_g1_i1.p1  ORF type:complete len:341 (-),score=55.77 TRINITY_DN13863_c0_g1_i1:368-1390(-)
MAATPPADRMWLVWALCAMSSFATNNFLLSAVGEEATAKFDANVSAIFVVWAVAGVYGVYSLLSAGPKTIIEGMNGTGNVLLMLAVGFVNGAAMLCLTLALATDPDSAGPITAMLPLNSVLVSALAWLILKETLGPLDILGIGIACAGPICMAVADMSGNALRGLMYGFMTACCFGGSNFLRKLVAGRGASSRSIVTCLFLVIGCFSLVSILGCCLAGRGLAGLTTPTLVSFAAVSGALWVLGGIFFQQALTGKAGPASAITNTNSVGVLALQLIFYQPSLKPLKIIGMALCIAGVSILSLKPKAKSSPQAASSARQFDGLNVSLQAPDAPEAAAPAGEA